MLMVRGHYPADWDAITFAAKEEADWKCEEFDKVCRGPIAEILPVINHMQPSASRQTNL